MVGVVHDLGPKATAKVIAKGADAKTQKTLIYAVFAGYSDYVYIFGFEPTSCKIDSMRKVWNDGYAAAHMPRKTNFM